MLFFEASPIVDPKIFFDTLVQVPVQVADISPVQVADISHRYLLVHHGRFLKKKDFSESIQCPKGAYFRWFGSFKFLWSLH